MARTLAERILFDSGLKVGVSPVMLASGGRERRALARIGRAGSWPRLVVSTGALLTTYRVEGDALVAEGNSANPGKLASFAADTAAPVARVEIFA
jgi:hypothetical protein